MRTNGFDPTEEQVLRYEIEADRMKGALNLIMDTVMWDDARAIDADLVALRMGIDTVHANVHALAHVLERNGVIGHGEFIESLIHQMGLFADEWQRRFRQLLQEGLDAETNTGNKE
jgi:hypothetical protein